MVFLVRRIHDNSACASNFLTPHQDRAGNERRNLRRMVSSLACETVVDSQRFIPALSFKLYQIHSHNLGRSSAIFHRVDIHRDGHITSRYTMLL